MGGLLEGGGGWGWPKGMVAPPLKLLGGLAPPLPPPSSYAYGPRSDCSYNSSLIQATLPAIASAFAGGIPVFYEQTVPF